ncbi:hypothetical protein ACJDU8_22395 [Clostridium sp. WILCCON 0269]|uniref:Uncharacterized protein n=1 Tax=Candidatus Clostridium eludens TaxID=3381663 RepID=A0ABW8SQN8_9CLOT
MKNFNITQISIVIQVDIGNISELRKKAFDELLIANKEFNTSILSPIGIVYIKNSNNTNLIITSNKITYITRSSTLDEEFLIILRKIYEKLILPQEIVLSFNIQATSDAENSIQISKDIFNSKFNNVLGNFNDVSAVGYRFFINNNEMQCDIKLEPFLNNDSKYIYQISGVLKNIIKIDDIKPKIDNQVESFKSYIESIMQQMSR